MGIKGDETIGSQDIESSKTNWNTLYEHTEWKVSGNTMGNYIDLSMNTPLNRVAREPCTSQKKDQSP